jgi:hypothetical protein
LGHSLLPFDCEQQTRNMVSSVVCCSFWTLLAHTKDQCDYYVREIKRFIAGRVTEQCVLKMRLLLFELHAAQLLVSPRHLALSL